MYMKYMRTYTQSKFGPIYMVLSPLTHCICVLQVKYDHLHQALYDKRRLVVGSEYEPTDEECDFPSDDETDDEKNLSKDMEEKAKIDEKDENK